MRSIIEISFILTAPSHGRSARFNPAFRICHFTQRHHQTAHCIATTCLRLVPLRRTPPTIYLIFMDRPELLTFLASSRHHHLSHCFKSALFWRHSPYHPRSTSHIWLTTFPSHSADRFTALLSVTLGITFLTTYFIILLPSSQRHPSFMFFWDFVHVNLAIPSSPAQKLYSVVVWFFSLLLFISIKRGVFLSWHSGNPSCPLFITGQQERFFRSHTIKGLVRRFQLFKVYRTPSTNLDRQTSTHPVSPGIGCFSVVI